MSTQKTRKAAALGDSLTEGFPFNAKTPWPQLLAVRRVGHKFALANFALSGSKVASMIDRYTQQVEGQGFTHVLFFGGTNNFSGTAPEDTVAAVQTHVTNLITRCIADTSGSPNGTKVILMSIAPRGGAAGYNATIQTKLDQYNAWIATLPATYPNNVRFVDAYTALGQSGSPTVLATAYDNGDGLHFKQAGEVKIADTVDAANVLDD